MLRFWSRAPQAQSTCGCVSCLSTSSGGLASRTASAASKRRLRIGNSVTALYTSIFAAAALADAQAKDQRRLEWKEKIAAVKEEVNELVDEERRLLEALASRQKPRLFNATFHARQHRPFQMTSEIFSRRPGQLSLRSYHSQTVTKNSKEKHNKESEVDAGLSPELLRENSKLFSELSSEGSWNVIIPRESLNRHLDDDTPDDVYVTPDAVHDADTFRDPLLSRLAQDERGFAFEKNTIPLWLVKDKARMKAIRVVALKQLAIRFLLRPTIAHDYLGLRAQYETDPSQPRLRTQQLLYELNKLRRKMMKLKTRKQVDPEDIVPGCNVEADKYRSFEVDRQIRTDVEDYLCGDASLDELLIKLAHSLANSPDPDRVVGLKYMLLAFTRTRQTDLAELVLKAILPNMFPLNSSLILAILTHNYRTKNLRGWDTFLDMLSGKNFPVDIGKLGFFKPKRVNNIDITIPPSSSANAVVYSTLILGCLNFGQPDRANAYLSYARSIGYMDSFPTLNAYLKYYGNQRDWRACLQIMKRALAFMASSTEHPEVELERLITLMVRACDNCNAHDLSEALIVTAVNSGFAWESAMKQIDLIFPADLDYKRWETARDSSSSDMSQKPIWEKCYAFVNAASDKLNDLGPDAEPARRWMKLMDTYSQQVLSSMVSGAPTEFKQAGNLIAQLENLQISQSPNVDDQTSSYSNDIAEAHQREISSLKDEVSQLKQMVFELTQTTSNTPTAAPEQVSPPTDMGELKAQLSTTELDPTEPPAHMAVNRKSSGQSYRKSFGKPYRSPSRNPNRKPYRNPYWNP
ncbi:uncharacterized protein KD926_009639 [Aspergillus affinis]|uniref:uncharacterized protein n=1 Tax=Aspergillus affinis TaxID=1070780 RepID=UPI0022FE476A|nr:uncharacterized protein KD926_009639 [Aspergillus affinis]KAI9045225.1 hypothetical protein KD926_009639 [Aspergillus affinis]